MRTAYALDGDDRRCLFVGNDGATLRVSVLCDVDAFDTLVNLDVYVRRSHDSGELTLVEAIRTDLDGDVPLSGAALPGISAWVERDPVLRDVCSGLVVMS